MASLAPARSSPSRFPQSEDHPDRDSQIYQLLYANDDRFQRHFKVKAHMDSQVDAENEAILEYARALAHHGPRTTFFISTAQGWQEQSNMRWSAPRTRKTHS